MYTYKYYVNYFNNSEAYLSFLFINGIITIEFFASGIRNQLPFLCSLPTPAIRWFPSGVKVSAFMKPVTLISNNKFKDLKSWPHCHNFITPFREPRNHSKEKENIDNIFIAKQKIWWTYLMLLNLYLTMLRHLKSTLVRRWLRPYHAPLALNIVAFFSNIPRHRAVHQFHRWRNSLHL